MEVEWAYYSTETTFTMKLTDVKTRKKIPAFLSAHYPQGSGVELGVHTGEYSDTLLANSDLRCLYSIDRWAGDRGHGMVQYHDTMIRLSHFGQRSRILRATFDEARHIFPDHSFDFIYIDGYAHTGQNDGKTILDWWKKLRPGGLFAGHDYHHAYPKTISEVDRFVAQVGGVMHLTGEAEYPSWMLVK